MYGGGRQLYDQLWTEMGMNIKGLMLQPVGPEALGWFKEPINNMAGFSQAPLSYSSRYSWPDL